MKYIVLLVFAFLIVEFVVAEERMAESSYPGGEPPILTVAIHNNSLSGHLIQWSKGVFSCNELIEYHDDPKDRGGAELTLICSALKHRGVEARVRLRGTPNHVRSLFLVESGIADIAAESVWLEDIDLTKVYASEAVIDHGEFEKMLYTMPSHRLHDVPPESLDLRDYQGVVLRSWSHDRYTLTQRSKEVLTAVDQTSIFRMIEAGRADYTLLENHNHGDEYFTHSGTKLIPVAGVYVVLEGTRHMVVSKHSEHGVWLRRHLSQGLHALKKVGLASEIYERSGFLGAAQKGWREIEPFY